MEAAVTSLRSSRILPGPFKIRNPVPPPTGVIVPLEGATLLITHDIVLQAKRYIEEGATKGKLFEWRDAGQKGLVLRLTATAATWYVRRRATTLRIGTIADTCINTAREMTRKATSLEEANLDARVFLDKVLAIRVNQGDEKAYYYEEGLWVDDGGTIHGPEVPMPVMVWTWSYLRKMFLAEKLPGLAPRWASQYEQLLMDRAFEHVEHKPVGLLEYKDLEIIKLKLKKTRTMTQASRSVSMARAMLDWAYTENRSSTGLDKVQFVFWDRWKISRQENVRDHVPQIDELARTLVLVEYLESLSGAARGPGAVDASLLGALWATILTGQRVGQLLQTPVNRYFESPDAPEGWTVVTWLPGEMKKVKGSPLPHSLPLPPETIAIIQRFRSNRAEAGPGWLFPSSRGSGHVSAGGLGSLLRRLQGIRHRSKDKVPGQPDGRRIRGRTRTGASKTVGVDLFAENDIAPWIPHDVRRALATFLEDEGLGGSASAILAHREHRKEDKREHASERALAVTRIHYSRSQKIGLKAQGMALWTKAILEAYEVEKTKFAEKLQRNERLVSSTKSWCRPAVVELRSMPAFEA